MEHNQLLLFNHFDFWLHVQHHRRCFPANDYKIINHHHLILDAPAVVYNQLHDFVRLYIQHHWRRIPTNHDTLNHQQLNFHQLNHHHLNHHNLILDTPTVVHYQLHNFVRLYIQHNWRRFPANHHAIDDKLVVLQ